MGPIGLTVGWYHVLTAPRWSWRDKIVAGLLPVPLVCIPVTGRADLGAETCRQSGTGAITCASHPVLAALVWVVLVAGLVIVAWMIRHLSRSARRPVTHPVTSRLAALVLAVAMASTTPTLVDRLEDTWSHGERDAVIDAASKADEAGEPYTVIDASTSGHWISGSDARPSEGEMRRLAGQGNARFARVFDELVAERWDAFGGPELSAADRRTCHVFPVVDGGDERIEGVQSLTRICYGMTEQTSSIRLDSPH